MAKTPQQYLIGASRRIWRWSKERREVKSLAYCGSKRYVCALCPKNVENHKKIHIDHINPVGKAPKGWTGWDRYFKRLFCSVDNLQALCAKCHKKKTAQDRRKNNNGKSC